MFVDCLSVCIDGVSLDIARVSVSAGLTLESCKVFGLCIYLPQQNLSNCLHLLDCWRHATNENSLLRHCHQSVNNSDNCQEHVLVTTDTHSQACVQCRKPVWLQQQLVFQICLSCCLEMTASDGNDSLPRFVRVTYNHLYWACSHDV